MERHEHSGKSSRDLLDPEKILTQAGLKRGNTFLDAGCGEGHFSFVASEIVGETGRVHAVDIYEEAINAVKKESHERGIGNIRAVSADLTKTMPITDGSIDMCLMADVFHGFVTNEEVDSSLGEIYRVLKDGGLFVVVEFKKIEDPIGPPLHVRLTPDEVKEILAPYGFKDGQIIEAGEYHYAITFTK
ncbi:MAG: class I SAM-dependent methyltransferase [Candidatus Hydrothermarchaeaceae archaeon]